MPKRIPSQLSKWLTSIRLQLAILLTLAVTVTQVASLWIMHNQNGIVQEAINRFQLLEHTASEITLLNTLQDKQRDIAINALNDHRKGLILSTTPLPLDQANELSDLQQRLATLLDFSSNRLQLSAKHTCSKKLPFKEPENPLKESNSPCGANFFINAQLDDGNWLSFYFRLGPPSKLLLKKVFPGAIISLFLVLLITNTTLKRLFLPLKHLSNGAEKVGRGESYTIPETGPHDVKQTIIAFNRMQEKINRYVSDRTHLMAAISHDLRTPITAMRLRVELLDDGKDKTKILETLEEMEAITQASLNFVRESNDTETAKDTDISALLASICDDLQDNGLKTHYQHQNRVIYPCRGKSLKRALTNLIENGAIYGDCVEVTLQQTSQAGLEIRIFDHGEGIPENMHESIFEPFVRLDGSRNRQTGGTGLGMSIARTIVRHHGGDIQLHNSIKGFNVIVSLP